MIKEKKKTVNLVNQISTELIQNNVIKKNQYILISISGGQDSICVFFILLQLKRQWKWSFGIIYCNHLWQPNSFYTSSFIIELASIFHIPMYCSVTSAKIFNEYQSRYWRYNIFYRLSFFYHYDIISTGHTLSDKIETILFQLIRGTSTPSLTSLHNIKHFFYINNFSKNNRIKRTHLYFEKILKNIEIKQLFHSNYVLRVFLQNNFKRKIYKKQIISNLVYVKYPIIHTLAQIDQLRKVQSDCDSSYDLSINSFFLIRPILSLHRFDLKKLSIFWKLPLYPDVSNQKKYYYRNRIRKQLLPTLRFFFNSQIDNTFFQFTEILVAEQIYLQIVINRLKNELQIQKNTFLPNSVNFWLIKQNSQFNNRIVFTKPSFFNTFNSSFSNPYLKIESLPNLIKTPIRSLEILFCLNTSFFYTIPLAIQRKLIKEFLESYTSKQIQFFQIDYVIQLIKRKKVSNFHFVVSLVPINIFYNSEVNTINLVPFNFLYLNIVITSKKFIEHWLIANRDFSDTIPKTTKQNSFNFSNLINQTLMDQTLVDSKLNQSFFKNHKSKKYRYLYNNSTNIFLSKNYFQKFQTIFYPEIGVLLNFDKKLSFIT